MKLALSTIPALVLSQVTPPATSTRFIPSCERLCYAFRPGSTDLPQQFASQSTATALQSLTSIPSCESLENTATTSNAICYGVTPTGCTSFNVQYRLTVGIEQVKASDATVVDAALCARSDLNKGQGYEWRQPYRGGAVEKNL